ncbi:hypothetical protein EJB05_55061, partial [Eragrostis curvula]
MVILDGKSIKLSTLQLLSRKLPWRSISRQYGAVPTWDVWKFCIQWSSISCWISLLWSKWRQQFKR